MLFKLFLCFTLIPAVEIYLLIKVGTVIGSFNTVLLVIATGFFGAWLARMEGLNTMFKVRQSLDRGIIPEEELIDAFIIFLAGIVLIAPGLLTDVFGLLLLWPVGRNAFKRFIRQKMKEFNDSKEINITRYH
ncbi:MAG: FxsA family protein [Desulfobacterium sp.]|jgi:UPF0716 protein FxsA|nr:FxsA family protein [Desulfobacterium sp.]